MFLSKAKIDNVETAVVSRKYEIRSLDVTMDVSFVVHLLNGDQHFNEDKDGNPQIVALLQVSFSLGKIHACTIKRDKLGGANEIFFRLTEQIHHDEILIAVWYEVVEGAHVGET